MGAVVLTRRLNRPGFENVRGHAGGGDHHRRRDVGSLVASHGIVEERWQVHLRSSWSGPALDQGRRGPQVAEVVLAEIDPTAWEAPTCRAHATI